MPFRRRGSSPSAVRAGCPCLSCRLLRSPGSRSRPDADVGDAGSARGARRRRRWGSAGRRPACPGVVDEAKLYDDMYWLRAGGNVRSLLSVTSDVARRNSFQVLISANAATAPKAGRDMGMAIDQRVRRMPAPSIAAASDISGGRSLKKTLKKITPIGREITVVARINPSCEPSRPRCARREYSGKTSTMIGTSCEQEEETPPAGRTCGSASGRGHTRRARRRSPR